MTSLGLAWRSTKRYRVRAVLAVIGVAIIGALLFDMLLLSRGLLDSFADLLSSSGFDIRIVGSEGVPIVRFPIDGSTRLAAHLRALREGRDRVLVPVRPDTAEIEAGKTRDSTLVGAAPSGERSP